MFVAFVALVGIVFANFANAAIIKGGVVIPTYSDPCKRSDKNFNGCIKKTLQELLPKFSNGIPELNISSLDPFFLDEYLLHYDSGDISGKCLYKNVYTSGLMNVKITDVRSDIEDPDYFEMEIDFYFPKVVSTGNYKAEGLIGNFPVQGKGIFNVTAFNVTGTMHLIGHSVNIEGEKHMKITDLRLKEHEIGDMKIFATNLINGNPELSQMALTFANQFWRIFHQLMLPNIQEGFEKVGRPFINQLFLQIPYDQLLPPNRK
jgi:hypothetical protein